MNLHKYLILFGEQVEFSLGENRVLFVVHYVCPECGSRFIQVWQVDGGYQARCPNWPRCSRPPFPTPPAKRSVDVKRMVFLINALRNPL